jgi:hypothetical protein
MKKLIMVIAFVLFAAQASASGLEKEDYLAGYIASIATSLIVTIALVIQSYRVDGVEFEVDPDDEEAPVQIIIHW